MLHPSKYVVPSAILLMAAMVVFWNLYDRVTSMGVHPAPASIVTITISLALYVWFDGKLRRRFLS